ncbi:P-loop NTPase [Haladaptatus sp. DYF46]|uniref:MinD/ParA family ATP-binding protein n=1 Tax=Haladaptatus sp. DYF46 TaxID=2886041 RepID=UPI001E60A690|nr:P-loop NTPase [Haladaptatus sp. DYF46]
MNVAVTGGKGGVGKSTVALNLGAELGGVVVDADLAMADLPTARGPDLHDVLAGRADPLEAVSNVGDVLLLPCGRTLAGARSCDVTEFVDAIARVASEYDHVIIDCPAGMSADAGLPLVAADGYVLVTIPRPFALADAVRTKALARRLDAGLCRVVLNRVREDPPIETVEKRLGAPVTTVPESRTVAEAQRNGRPVATAAPESEARERFSELGRAVYSCRS